jgi:hypothetical protein
MNCPICNRKIDPRTLSQNAYFHLIVTIYGEEVGQSLEEQKCIIKTELGLVKEGINKKTGESFPIYESSKDWGKKKFASVIDYTIRSAGELGISLPICPDRFTAHYEGVE